MSMSIREVLPTIQFTFEVESVEGILNFLDISIRHNWKNQLQLLKSNFIKSGYDSVKVAGIITEATNRKPGK